ncbi:phosphogluconate dehydratase [Thiothrix nivea]|uniref:Phosphogluconate dehydratase n=1 Tax=Thiothrix nivea (strain ATCC 35100 / DSM 5205 / JP2) TaxID=870187 RepID=A0A656HLD2_THINJ|nr:phosphogluconate dehydratase [Thiothrix nivea]EIJ36326.1 6-phosphogluconate dehydratase [Thiothrix nivea DSM 5205]
MALLHQTVEEITGRIRARSLSSRRAYLARIDHAVRTGPVRGSLACTNLAHAFAAAPTGDKQVLRALRQPNLAIVSSYNDMLSAHQPLAEYPTLIKQAANELGATAQFAGGVPAMCDGVTQGQPGMELSLFSRDTIALATAVALSHNSFDAAVYLGVCDKIVPGLLIGALSFGHLPAVFIPAGPMTSGMSNDEKAKTRQLFAEGKIGRDVLLEAESRSYHSAGTCTFYGTANSNQMLMEVMGLHVPGSAFVNPGTPLRDALTRAAALQALKNTALGEHFTPVGRMIDERSMVNAIVALLATGGSTNHTMHLVAIAHAAGIQINWDDFNGLSAVVPLLARVYPNGKADVNQFHAAGGSAYLIRELLGAGLLHADAQTVTGTLADYASEPWLHEGKLAWRAAAEQSGDTGILRPANEPFEASGGLRLLQGNLGRAVIKVSAVKPEHRVVEAPALVFNDQDEVAAAFKRGELERDFIAVIRFQGPRANGMPELHKLTPPLAVLQGRGFKVALVTDGRMSGASGKVPAAIHVTPEAVCDGPLARVRDGDLIRLDGETGELNVLIDPDEWAARTPDSIDISHAHWGMGRELFDGFRVRSVGAEQGALSILCDLFDIHYTPSSASKTQVEA